MKAQKYFQELKENLEQALQDYMPSESKEPVIIHKGMRYALFDQAKRYRPIFMLSLIDMLSGSIDFEEVLPAACALEIVHCASLVHDDLPCMDNSDTRRGKKSVHQEFGEAMAILIGDALIGFSFEILLRQSNPRHVLFSSQILSQSIGNRGMIAGQAVDILSENKKVKIETVNYIHTHKTAALLEAAAHFACLLTQQSQDTTQKLAKVAQNIGISYQIIDDLLDYSGDEDVLGKPASDSVNKKVTYPLLVGLDKSRRKVRNLLRECHEIVGKFENNFYVESFVNMIERRIP